MSCLEQIKCCVDNTIYKLSINISKSVAPDPDVKESSLRPDQRAKPVW